MTRKNAIQKTSSSNQGKDGEILSTDQVWDVLNFAQKAYSSYGLGGFSPELVSSRLKDVSLSPNVATREKIEQALNSPKESEELLVGYSEFFELQNMLYKRVIRYMSNMLSWNMSYVCTNAEDADYESDKYKKDLSIVRNFFDKMNIKNEFGQALRQMVRRETFFSFFRDDGENYVFQELPRQYCKITARSEWGGLLFDFSTLWFLQPGVSIEMYPSIFKKFYNETLTNRGGVNNGWDMYNPATPVDNRNSHWIYWHQTSPILGFFCFKLTPEIATEIPMFASLFPDLINQPIIRTLQTNSYIQQASKIITSQVPYLNKDSKSGATKDNVSVTPKMLGEFLNILRQGISQSIAIAALPTENTQGIEFTGDNDMYDSYLKSTSGLSGINSRLIYTTDKQNTLETRLSTDVDKYFIKPVYAQFEAFLNYQVNKLTKKFKFKFFLSGTEFSNEKEERMAEATGLANIGIVLPHKFANALDMNPFDFERMLAEGRGTKWTEKLTPIVSAFQQSGGGKDGGNGGRPKKSMNDLSDSGEQTQSDGGNLDR